VAGVEVRTLTDGGQPAEQTAHALADFLSAAQHSLEIAVYDLHLPPDLVQIVRDPLLAAHERGVAVRLAYNVDHPNRPAASPPPSTDFSAVEALPFPTAAIPASPT
jgi:Phosphatidylserine/phosphatidylglycerophosphate/cardiolipin synthases and related enzymes